ncbi:hypothetical protein KUCAC02_034929 [Chaenocephalus aceratus]|nr:hypothetical protein KUCAC02_034929 [Chaenocephalus aceratus]
MLQKSCCGPEESTWSAGELINNAGLLKCSRRAKATLAAGEVMSSTNMPFTHQTPRWCGASVDPPSAGQETSEGDSRSRRSDEFYKHAVYPSDTTMVWSFCRSSVCWSGGEVTENLEPLQ